MKVKVYMVSSLSQKGTWYKVGEVSVSYASTLVFAHSETEAVGKTLLALQRM